MPPPLHGMEECEAFYSLVPSPVGTRTFWLFRGWFKYRFKYRPAPSTVNWDVATIHFQGIRGRGGLGAWGYDRVTLTTSAVLSDTNSSVVFRTLTHSFTVISEGTCLSFEFIFSFWSLNGPTPPPHTPPGFRDSYLIIYAQEFRGLISAGSR